MKRLQQLFASTTGRYMACTACCLLVCVFQSMGQVKYPVTASVQMNYPSPLYLSDYYTTASNKLMTSLVLNDFNEPSWNVRLKFTITTSNLKIETKASAGMSAPIVLYPGQLQSLSGDQLYDYLAPGNIEVSGSGASLFNATGRLPEGAYNFCVEVLDFSSGVPVSVYSCSTVWIQLKEPPLLISPACQSFVAPQAPQQVLFQWQPTSIAAGESYMLQYTLNLYELTDASADPKSAFNNGQVLHVYTSQPMAETTYYYGMADPVLERGKHYVYTITVSSDDGRDLFKNRGVSEICDFYYGYPEGGENVLLAPESQYVYGYVEVPEFSWTSSNKAISQQPFAYELTIVQVKEGQDSVEAMEANVPWYTKRLPTTYSTSDQSYTIDKQLDPLAQYAWKIQTWSDVQMVAESEVRTFNGPPIIEHFYARNYKVDVLRTDNADLDDLKGRARITLTDGEVEAEFSHIDLSLDGTRYYLEAGDIYFTEGTPPEIVLTPTHEWNTSATFVSDTIKLNKDGFFIHGLVRYPFPHATFDAEVPYITTTAQWFEYPDWQIMGLAYLDDSNQFDLLDPMGFRMEFDTLSKVIINKNKYYLELDGDLIMPAKVNYSSSDRLSYAFENVDQLYYWDNDDLVTANLVYPLVDQTALNIRSKTLTIDLSDRQSPGKQQADNSWKGIYYSAYQLEFDGDLDDEGQLAPVLPHTFDLTDTGDDLAWVDGTGMHFYYDHPYADSLETLCNTFPAYLTRLRLAISDNVVSDSYFRGSMFIPVVSETRPFEYVIPITNGGLMTGYLEGLEDYAYTFNEGTEDQEVNIVVRRAEFQTKDHLNMVLDMAFPSLNASLEDVTNFNVWGNGNIGFGSENGSIPITEQVTGKVRVYEIILDGVGAGRQHNNYAFAATFKINMSEDISGTDGATTTNFYSVKTHTLVSEDYEASDETVSGGMWHPVLGQYDASDLESLSDEETSALLQYEMTNALNSDPTDDQESVDDILTSLGYGTTTETVAATTTTSSNDTTTISESDLVQRSGLLSGLSDKEVELVEAIVAGLVAELTKPVTNEVTATLTRVSGKVDTLITSQTDSLSAQLGGEIETIASALGMQAISAINTENNTLKSLLERIVATSAQSISAEMQRSMHAAVATQITTPIKKDLSYTIPNRLNDSLRIAITRLVIASLEQSGSAGDLLDAAGSTLGTTAEAVGSDVYQTYIKPKAIAERIQRTGTAFIEGYNWNNVLNMMKEELIASLNDPEVLASLVGEGVAQGLENVFGENTVGNNLVATGLSFAKMVSFKDGKLHLDPSNINVYTNWVSLVGTTHFVRDDPTYGDVWQSEITLTIKKPKDINYYGHYINGKTEDGVDYWFAQVANQDISPGGNITESPKESDEAVNLGVAKIMAASIRVFKHMNDDGGAAIVPDPSINFGGYFRFILFDNSSDGGVFRLDLTGDLVQYAEDDAFVLDFEGNMQLLSPSPSVGRADQGAMANAGIKIHYNGKEDHFLGFAYVDIKKAVCLYASLEVETKPGYWHVYIGDEYNMFNVTPACAGWGGQGYLKLDQEALEVALGVRYSLNFERSMSIGIIKLGIMADAYAALGIVAGLQYNPDIAVLKAGLWFELYVHILLKYKINMGLFSKKGSIELLEIYVKASLILYFQPTPSTLEGDIDGRVRVLGGLISTSFKAHMEKEL